MESDPPSPDEKEAAEKIIALACGNTGLVNFISVGLMIICTSFQIWKSFFLKFGPQMVLAAVFCYWKIK